MDVSLKDGVVYALQRGDTVVVTLATQPSTQQRLLVQRQLNALFRQQKVVILDPGMTFTVYRDQPPAAATVSPPEPEPEKEPEKEPEDEKPSSPPRRR